MNNDNENSVEIDQNNKKWKDAYYQFAGDKEKVTQ